MEQKKYMEFTRVSRNLKGYRPGRGSNVKRIFEELDNDTFRYTEGDIGVKIGIHKPRKRIFPMTLWEQMTEETLQAGWHLLKSEKMEEVTVEENRFSVSNEEVKDIVNRLIAFQEDYIAENTSRKIDDLPDTELEKGKKILDYMDGHQRNLSVEEFNNLYLRYLEIIPRNIKHLSTLLAGTENDIPVILEKEYEFYDMIIGYLRRNKGCFAGKDILESNGLTIRKVTEKEMAWIREQMETGECKVENAWCFVHWEREKRFLSFCNKYGLTDSTGISILKHGTRSENVWSIMSNGIRINPGAVKPGVVITGNAFGKGAYHAVSADKSRGYTSISDSRWAKGGNPTGFMFLNRVATGDKTKQYEPSCCDSSLNWEKLQKVQPGALCTWYHAGSGIRRNFHFYMDEIITYLDEQIGGTSYLVEFS